MYSIFFLYLQREINEVFEQLKVSDGLHRSVSDDHGGSNKLLPEKENQNARKVNKIGSDRSKQQLLQQQRRIDQKNVRDEEVTKTTEWANTILKELDNLMQFDKSQTAVSESPVPVTAEELRDASYLEKKATIRDNILKPKKHVSTYVLPFLPYICTIFLQYSLTASLLSSVKPQYSWVVE